MEKVIDRIDRLVDMLGSGLATGESCPGCGGEISLDAGTGPDLDVLCACRSVAALV